MENLETQKIENVPENNEHSPDLSHELAKVREAMEAIDSTVPNHAAAEVKRQDDIAKTYNALQEAYDKDPKGTVAGMNERNKYKTEMGLKSDEFSLMTTEPGEAYDRLEKTYEIRKAEYETYHGPYTKQINNMEEAMAYIDEISEMNDDRTIGIRNTPKEEESLEA